MTGTVLAPPALEGDGAPVEPAVAPQTRAETVLRLAALVVGTTLVSLLIDWVGGWPWVLVVWSVIVIIMLHELGHFATAKWSGMKATEFFVGFGPRLWSIRRGETEYGVKALPLGGYVKILGMTSMEELDPSDEPRSYVNQSTAKRVLVASAGSIVHVLIALALAFIALWSTGESVLGRVQVASVVRSAPAATAGLRPGDQLVSINGRPVSESTIVADVQSSKGRPVPVVVVRHGARTTLTITPAKTKGCPYALCIGVNSDTMVLLRHVGVGAAATGAGTLVWQVGDETARAFASAFSPNGLASLAHQVSNSKAGAAAASAPNGTHSMAGALVLAVDAAKAGFRPFLGLLISLNISLAVLNMLPMLPLDGGHVAIALYERIRTRKGRPRYRADVAKLMPAVYAFMAFLLLFVAGKMYLDFAHGVANPFH